jgi:CDP-diacylglycerol---glycerol-3-phosphate 3-phosphatidyltransferase
VSTTQAPHDPTALATWANAITVARMLLAPLLFVLIESDAGSWPALLMWTALCSTDFVDGWLARRQGTTNSGAFLDPLADKVLVLGAMFVLVHEGVFWVVPVAVIAGRELLISLYRSVAGTRGVSIPASRAAKAKTVAQQFAVAFALFPVTALDATWTWQVLLWIAVVLTVWTGAKYLMNAGRVGGFGR